MSMGHTHVRSLSEVHYSGHGTDGFNKIPRITDLIGSVTSVKASVTSIHSQWSRAPRDFRLVSSKALTHASDG